MARFFVPPSQVHGDIAVIEGSDVRHVKTVLRKVVGDALTVSTGVSTYQGTIAAITDAAVEVQIVRELEETRESPLYTCLFQGLAKGDKVDLVVQKAVELGVSEVVPFTSRYTVVQLEAKKAAARRQRWQRIAESAAKQARRAQIPVVSPVCDFPAVLQRLEQDGDQHILIPWEGAASLGQPGIEDLQCPPTKVSLIIGSEGGFSQVEVHQVTARGGVVVSLGPRILRTETAGLAALTLVQYLWGDLQ